MGERVGPLSPPIMALASFKCYVTLRKKSQENSVFGDCGIMLYGGVCVFPLFKHSKKRRIYRAYFLLFVR